MGFWYVFFLFVSFFPFFPSETPIIMYFKSLLVSHRCMSFYSFLKNFPVFQIGLLFINLSSFLLNLLLVNFSFEVFFTPRIPIWMYFIVLILLLRSPILSLLMTTFSFMFLASHYIHFKILIC